MKQLKGQQGFTLVEIAIVLVIVGLLLGGVLKGQSMIENARVAQAANSVNGIIAAVNTYLDRYGRLPGDDGNLAALRARGGAWDFAIGFGNQNGIIENVQGTTFTAAAGEGIAFWQHLRAAGLIRGEVGATGPAALPHNPFGGSIGFTNGGVYGMPAGNKICLGSVPGATAQALDSRLDDGRPDQGIMRAHRGNDNAAPGATPVATAFNENFQHTMCIRF
ncbi:MAG: prepilin-type N-terminal cleavage/methylation domain-containing protein [Desulfobulbaceae bacterium]|nr:MAG: prepilin-type N-terminal cleavage/methylation domain-containing protein [Desulfobulbaceae bacterium]